MTKIEDGGPAFPTQAFPLLKADPESGGLKMACSSDGMSLRDWFAGHALCGILASPGRLPISDNEVSQTAASASFIMADAMLAARKGGQ